VSSENNLFCNMKTSVGDDWSILCCLAEKGYFLSDHSAYAENNKIPFQDVIQQPFGIRLANSHDIPSLLEIEQLCWGPMQMQVSQAVLMDRITSCPLDQWVATRQQDGQVVGVIYTQRIASLAFAQDKSFTFAHLPLLRDATGSVLQLVGVAVLPTAKDLQLGRALRDFMLLQAHTSEQIQRVVAITRCSSFLQNCPEAKAGLADAARQQLYVDYVWTGRDPTLQFHCGGGARVLSIMPRSYRSEDSENLSSGVLIGYFCSEEEEEGEGEEDPCMRAAICPEQEQEQGRRDRSTFRDSETLRHTATMLPSFDAVNSAPLTLDLIRDLVVQVLGDSCGGLVTARGFEDQPFMVLGMDSLQMVDFTRRLALVTTGEGSLSSTFLFDHPTPRWVLEYFLNPHDGVRGGHDGDEKRGEKQCEEAVHVEYAVVGMSCRFPGGADSPEKFYQLLSNRYNPLGPVPESWEWLRGNQQSQEQGDDDSKSTADTSKRKIGLLDDMSAESFDSSLFGLSKAEVASMDPHQRLLLTIGYEALLDAEVLVEDDAEDDSCRGVVDTGKHDVGVYVGLCNARWSGIEMQAHTQPQETAGAGTPVSAYSGMGTAGATAANRLSFLLNLVGPSMVVDTACSSSLVAVHTACQALRAGDCSSALVAAADLLLCPYDLEVYGPPLRNMRARGGWLNVINYQLLSFVLVYRFATLRTCCLLMESAKLSTRPRTAMVAGRGQAPWCCAD
jgi:polyketide synthase PksM